METLSLFAASTDKNGNRMSEHSHHQSMASAKFGASLLYSISDINTFPGKFEFCRRYTMFDSQEAGQKLISAPWRQAMS